MEASFWVKGLYSIHEHNTRGPTVRSHALPTPPLELEPRPTASSHWTSVSSSGKKEKKSRAGHQHRLLTDAQVRGTAYGCEQNKTGGRLRLLDPCALSRFMQVINSTFNPRSFHLSCPLTLALLLNGETRAKKEKLTAWIAHLLLSKMPN